MAVFGLYKIKISLETVLKWLFWCKVVRYNIKNINQSLSSFYLPSLEKYVYPCVRARAAQTTFYPGYQKVKDICIDDHYCAGLKVIFVLLFKVFKDIFLDFQVQFAVFSFFFRPFLL